MNPSTSSSRPSGIPRPSRLPVPRAVVRPSPSKENLQQSSRLSIVNPRLRNAPSCDQLSSSTSSKPRIASTRLRQQDSSRSLRDSEESPATVNYNPTNEQTLRKASDDALFRKPSYARMREEDQSQLRGEDEMFPEVGAEEFEEQPDNTRDTRRKPPPSLSERAMETLQNIPPSPAVRKRGSSFFNPESPMRPASSGTQSSRPGSSYQSDASMRPPSRTSRPTSRAGHGQPNPVDFRASTNTFRAPKSASQAHTPLKRLSTSSLKTPSTNRNRTAHASSATSRLPSPGFVSSTQQRSPSPDKTTSKAPTIKPSSKTLSSRPLKPRASVNGLFRKPSMPSLDQSGELDRIGFVPKKKSTTFSNTSSEATSTTSKASKATTSTSVSNPDQAVNPRKSSALRDQIAKAKAAKRAASKQLSSTEMDNGAEVPVVPTATFDFGLSDDPFNQQPRESGAKGLLRKRIEAARTDGRLNIAAMGFKEIPEEVMNMYHLESIANQNASWAESVDLTRLVAADNEIELLQDDVFPDVDPRELMEDENAKGNQFGGLETLDLHGNILIALPLGLRRLELLTTLNLSNNKLGNECFVVISQIPSLRDLKIAGNGLVGALDSSIAKLQNLEVLDLQRNTLTSLPDGLADLVRLRVLNIAENRFNSLPFESLRHLPLIELLAAKNDLTGILVAAGVDELPQLQVLDITGNALKSLTAAENLSLPSLHQLNCSSNRLTCLPDIASWLSLRTLLAEDNNIASIPEGFTRLQNLMNVNLSGNNIKILDDGIGAMENLSIFRISGNPLREKKFAGMSTEELKRVLKARMEPAEPEIEKDSEADGAFYSAPVSPISPRPSSSDWPVKTGGVLDRSNTKSHSLNPVAAADVAANNTVKIVELHHNMFQEIPSSIAFFAASLTTLSLAHNELSSDTFMKDALDLPVLRELNLSSNTFSSVQPLIQRLKAPMLERLDISFNRLTSLPPLKPHFPSLVTLLVSNNTIKELSPESVKGLRTLDCSSNDINSLNARIGLLGGPGGLEKLDVSGNRFRVPKYTILEKGTEATLAWLRDRIPADEISSTDLG